MKRVLSMMVIVIFILTSLLGCSKKDSVKEENTSIITNETSEQVEEETATVGTTQDIMVTAQDGEEINLKFSEQETTLIYGDFDNSGETYDSIYENNFVESEEEATSTFSIDVDTASYSNLRNLLQLGMLPDEDAVRIEEMINYFDYNYEQPEANVPFSITTKLSNSSWNNTHNIAMIGLQGIDIPKDKLPPSNIVLLIDVSGSMQDINKLPLLKKAFEELVNNLESKDRLSLVVYAGAAGVIIEGADGNNEDQILEAIDSLEAGGSTAGGEGIELAYAIAKKYFIEEGNNRVVLATDGDFNVGMSTTEELEEFISEKKDEGIYLSVLGFGRGNTRDDMMEILADKGNGNYFYIDTIEEANKVFSDELTGTLFAIAKDVKIQVEFNPEYIEEYRLIGYENRVMANEDFEDDSKDAGELGVGHEVTALYDIIPKEGVRLSEIKDSIMTVKLRYKEIDEEDSKELVEHVDGSNFVKGFDNDLTFAMAIAEFGMILRDSEYKEDASIEHVKDAVNQCLSRRWDEYRAGFLGVIENYEYITNNR